MRFVNSALFMSQFANVRKIGYLIQFLYHLVKEIVIANFATMRLVCTSNRVVEPMLIQFDTQLKSDTSKFLLANAITLTPGTITVAMTEDDLLVHCLDKSLSEGMEDSVFVRVLKKLEEV